ncbi:MULTISPECIES: D-alanyl-D-alanine carboxypeptidase [unclassified Streptomyces]|uniref:D-alanyl-D-alanine carboxypeptidase family protein n=1 Tax=unclassified Streptomyces TaxID=2593676 RepID=UPI002948B8A7|nr:MULTISPECIES: D-alanyl-D-alanine carboxypeptidase [unclassified Streptomyces]
MSASKKTAWAVAAALLLPLVAAVPAHADPKDDKEKQQPKPPAAMSSLGGALLGLPGTQVRLGPGAPVLPKELSARSWIVADAEQGTVLASHNAHWPLAPASTLKMLFADTVLPRLPRTQNHLVDPSELTGMGAGSSLVGIKEKQTYSVHDLWLGVFLKSGNDAVHVLSGMNGGLEKTVREMNENAIDLQALDTHVVSPDGYDAPGQVSSAYDLTLIARDGMRKPDFREYAATARAAFPGEQKPGKKRETFEIQNTNRLLTGDFGVAPYPGIAGVKNGNTTHAGATFTGVAERNGRVLLVTVMNPSSKERHAVYQEAARLLDWGFAAAGKVTPVGELVPPLSARTQTPSSAPSAATPAPGKDTPEGTVQATVASGHSGGVGIALAVAGGALALLAGAAFLVNRRWPTAASAGRRRSPDSGADPDSKPDSGPDSKSD